ncbi:YlxR family protein [Oleidesulfovibrio sp.]|uniref:YlxR family protein n=1 Tax=Oleidesulfovibrio sp. TaxID=2909707 RepID=UPI003A845938
MTDGQKHIPIRTCVICRRRFAKSDLLRYVSPPGEPIGDPVADEAQTQPGRGYYVCSSEQCRQRFPKFRGWRRKCKGVHA